ncbi:hypothetical protein [Leuconostoc mesenteroides]|uniref:hypothetical protein n=1 Tax=Leuconostoc mesenteroides TaxID=1245 RepID=UPI001C22DBA5|nr:hypothetical protein [Leuconostoc mesenteroides]QXC54906.1 hypothetical protein EZV74_09380 [Leuconostoc mesenteroides]
MKLIKWIDKHSYFYIVIIIVFVIVPLLIQFGPAIHLHQKVHGDWLSFWGSYLGIIPSGLIAYVIAKIQIQNDNQKNKLNEVRQKKDKFLLEVNKKLRALDPVFHNGRTNLAFSNSEFKPRKEVDINSNDELENQLEKMQKSLQSAKIFDILGELLLDIEMVSEIKEPVIFQQIQKLQNDFRMFSEQLNDYYKFCDSREDKVIIFRSLVKQYYGCFVQYQDTLKEISKSIYGGDCKIKPKT